jgi:hypothetical protein
MEFCKAKASRKAKPGTPRRALPHEDNHDNFATLAGPGGEVAR